MSSSKQAITTSAIHSSSVTAVLVQGASLTSAKSSKTLTLMTVHPSSSSQIAQVSSTWPSSASLQATPQVNVSSASGSFVSTYNSSSLSSASQVVESPSSLTSYILRGSFTSELTSNTTSSSSPTVPISQPAILSTAVYSVNNVTSQPTSGNRTSISGSSTEHLGPPSSSVPVSSQPAPNDTRILEIEATVVNETFYQDLLNKSSDRYKVLFTKVNETVCIS